MDKKYQDIHIVYIGDNYSEEKNIKHCIRQVKIKSIKNTDLFIELNVIDAKEKPNTIIIPKLFGVKVLID